MINKCENPALFRYTWPGKDESFICAICAIKLTTVANAIGLPLQMIRLSNEELLNNLECLQEVKEQEKK